ncbi:MAG: co-chaperone GroES [Elusimicrobiota bacterium]|nr:co-chaperone GroES [Elusimicrobiota bacterium]
MIKPLGDRVLIKPLQPKEVKKGGIIIPDTAKEKPQEGEVIAVGSGKKTEEGKIIALDVKKGDKVLYGKYSGTEVKFDDVEYLIMSQDDVLGIVE